MIDDAPFDVAILQPDGSFSYCNRHLAARALSIGRANPTGIFALLHIEDQTAFSLAMTQLRLSRKPQVAEIRLPNETGSWVWMAANLSIRAEKGAESILLQLNDIDNRKRAEEERKSWEERWNSALVSSQLGVWDHDFKTGVFYYSDTWKTMRGYHVEEVIDASFSKWLETVHPGDRDFVMEQVERQNSGEDRVSIFQYRERHRAGHYIWIECRGAAIEWDENGRPTRIVGTDADVTAYKETEDRLSQTSRRLELAIDVSNIGVFETDIESGSTFWDDRLLEIYGKTGQPNLQPIATWFEQIHPDDLPKVNEAIAERDPSNPIFSHEYRIVMPDGSIRFIRARVRPFIDGFGRRKSIGANWDVTEDQMIRQELEKANRLAEARNRELEAAKARIEHDALHDFLTGLPNRRYLDEVISKRTIMNVAREGLAILHVDLDRFKQINDTLGHRAGDAMLQHAARVLRDCTGPQDVVARIGGDEFVVVTPFTGSSFKLSRLSDTIIQKIREPVNFEGHICRIGASIGICQDEDPAADPRQMLLNADIALYRAKRLGRNRFDFFTSDIQAEVINTKKMSDEVLEGLEKREFIPFYQLQFCARSLNVAGVETLARWRHPVRGLLAPASFLSIAEDLEAVAAIDSSLMEQALSDFQRWRLDGVPVPRLSVNVSAKRLSDPNLAQELERFAIEPGTFSFELLETIFLDDCDPVAIRNLEMLRAAGIDIEIDDFGTGHASIVSLLTVNPQTLKIDRELVRSIGESDKQRKLVGSIIDIGRSLNIRVLAEGVETQDHVRILRDLGCDLLQGYALARPMPFEDIKGYIARNGWR